MRVVIKLTAEQEVIAHRIAAYEYKLLVHPYQHGCSVLGPEIREYFSAFGLLSGLVKHDVLDTIVLLDVDFFARYFGKSMRVFAWGVEEKNIPFIYVVAGIVIKGWKSVESGFDGSEQALWMPK